MYPRYFKSHGRLTILVFSIILAALFLHIFVVFLDLYRPSAQVTFWVTWFDMDREYNIPTLLNASMLAGCAYYAWRYKNKLSSKNDRFFWLGAGLLFTYMALDELLLIHEQAAEPIRKTLQLTNESPFFHAWVIPAIGLVMLGAAILFVFHAFNSKVLLKNKRFLAFLLFWASGIILLEMVGTQVFTFNSGYRLLMVPAEETFEITVAAAMLLHLRQK
jgi:hypothetical protein